MSSGFSILEEKGNNSPIRVVNTSGLGLAQGFTTQNSTGFYQIRRALCALFSEDEGQHRGSSRIWYEDWEHDQMDADDSYWNEWDWEPNDWSPSTQVYWQDDPSWWSYWPEEETEDVQPDEQSADPEEVQLVEAFNIASEAIRALKDAREAVRRIRQSRGHYAPESNSGKGMVPPSSSPASSPASAKGQTKGLGPCSRCGMWSWVSTMSGSFFTRWFHRKIQRQE